MALLQTVIGPVFYRLVYMSLTALAAGAAVLLVRRLSDKRFSPLWKYAMWLPVLAALVIPWRPQSPAAVLSPAEAVLEVSFREDYSRAEAAYSAILSEPQAPKEEIEAASAEVNALRVKTYAFDELLPLLWLCGAVSTAAFIAGEMFRLRRGIRRSKIDCDMSRYEALLSQCKAQLGMGRRVRITMQSHVRTPALLGFVRPQILLPGYAAEMSDQRLRYVILHELSHLRRGDGLVNALLLGLRALYWFNPLLWLLFRFVREDMELANDAAVLRGMDGDAQKEYSLSLVEVLAGCGKQRHAMLCMADSKKNIERRITMIQLGAFFKRRKWVIAVAGLLVIATVATLFLTTGSYGAIRVDSALEQRMEEIAQEQYAYAVYPPGFLITAVKIHGAYRENEIMKVFVTTWYSVYIEEDDGIREFSGGVVPAAVTYRENEDGTHTLMEYKEAEDGNHFTKSIHAFCRLPGGRNIRGLANQIIKHYRDYSDLRELQAQKLEAYLTAHGLALAESAQLDDPDLPPLTLEQSISQAILQRGMGYNTNAELHYTLLTEEADGLTKAYVAQETAQMQWNNDRFAVSSAMGSAAIYTFRQEEDGGYTLMDTQMVDPKANPALYAEVAQRVDLQAFAAPEMPRDILFGFGEDEYWVKGTPIGDYLPKGVFTQEYMPEFSEGFSSDGRIFYCWKKSFGQGDQAGIIRKLELELCDEGIARYYFKDYGIDDGYVYEDVNLTLEQAGKLAEDFARDFWQDGADLKFKHEGEGYSSIYAPGYVENWQAERGGKIYNVMVDLRSGAVVYAAVEGEGTM